MALSQTRLDSNAAVAHFINTYKLRDLKTCLYVGVAGNPLTHNGKPGPDLPELYKNMQLTTLDFDKKWNPDIVGDVTKPATFTSDTFDLVVMTQVIEHIPNIFDVPQAIKTLVNPQSGYAIIDCPWGKSGPGYHAEPPSFGDYWRISKDGMKQLFSNDFHIVETIQTDANVAVLLIRK